MLPLFLTWSKGKMLKVIYSPWCNTISIVSCSHQVKTAIISILWMNEMTCLRCLLCLRLCSQNYVMYVLQPENWFAWKINVSFLNLCDFRCAFMLPISSWPMDFCSFAAEFFRQWSLCSWLLRMALDQTAKKELH